LWITDTREAALEELKTPIYPAAQLELDFPFVLKKLGFSEQAFYDYIDAPRVEHVSYGRTRSILLDIPIMGRIFASLRRN